MEREPLPTCAALAPGEVIQAYAGPILEFTGRVSEVHVENELLWAVDSIGYRRLIDLDSYTVYRLPPSSPDCSPGKAL
jgi:transcription antitermination factor NusG